MSEHEALARFHYGVPRGTARSVIVGSAAPVKIISWGAITFAYHRVRGILLRFRRYDRSPKRLIRNRTS